MKHRLETEPLQQPAQTPKWTLALIVLGVISIESVAWARAESSRAQRIAQPGGSR